MAAHRVQRQLSNVSQGKGGSAWAPRPRVALLREVSGLVLHPGTKRACFAYTTRCGGKADGQMQQCVGCFHGGIIACPAIEVQHCRCLESPNMQGWAFPLIRRLHSHSNQQIATNRSEQARACGVHAPPPLSHSPHSSVAHATRRDSGRVGCRDRRSATRLHVGCQQSSHMQLSLDAFVSFRFSQFR